MAWRGVTYHPSASFEAEMIQAEATKIVLMEAVAKATTLARRKIPAGPGRIARTYYPEVDGSDVMLVTSSSFWHLLEYGSVHNPPYAPLRTGVEAAGFEFRSDAL